MIEIWGFALFAYVASATPGPNNVLLTAVGASVGIRRGLPALAGIVGGFAMMIFVLAVSVGQTVLLTDTNVQIGMRLVGFAVLLWLAWKIATAPVTPEGSPKDTDEPQVPGRVVGFFGAALFQWVNPKAWIVCAAAIAAYLNVDQAVLPQATLLAVTFIAAATIGCLPWLAIGTLVGRYLEGTRARIFNYAMAGLLVVSVVPMLL
ncbi:LysE family translocator [Saliniramus sp.]|uniref:LysE family translocator n=1 Tax=Saliniramus sp. TaxID=2986772 RepID=UPI002C06F943|nr:LysE family translocator [Saliniramus sp.]HMB10054.1 LysE family translocator [Saliniramus sp.]